MVPWKVLGGYGLFLVLIGVVGFLSNPEKAKTALISGSVFGGLCLLLAYFGWRGSMWAKPVSVIYLCLLGMVFVWRAWVSWQKVLAGEPKQIAAILISAMLGATVVVLPLLLFSKWPSWAKGNVSPGEVKEEKKLGGE